MMQRREMKTLSLLYSYVRHCSLIILKDPKIGLHQTKLGIEIYR
jgi:hypothetical protein